MLILTIALVARVSMVPLIALLVAVSMSPNPIASSLPYRCIILLGKRYRERHWTEVAVRSATLSGVDKS